MQTLCTNWKINVILRTSICSSLGCLHLILNLCVQWFLCARRLLLFLIRFFFVCCFVVCSFGLKCVCLVGLIKTTLCVCLSQRACLSYCFKICEEMDRSDLISSASKPFLSENNLGLQFFSHFHSPGQKESVRFWVFTFWQLCTQNQMRILFLIFFMFFFLSPSHSLFYIIPARF